MSGKRLGLSALVAIIAVWVLLNWLYYRAQETPQTIAERMRLTQGQMGTSQEVLERFKQKFGRYPASMKEADENGFGLFSMDMHRNTFLYRAVEGGQSYVLTSVGPDGQEGTADDIVRQPAEAQAPAPVSQ